MLQGVAVCCRELQCVAVSCSVLQGVAVCCSELQCDMTSSYIYADVYMGQDSFICTTSHVAVRSALQCVAVCCSVLQCVAACSHYSSYARHNTLRCAESLLNV